MQNLWVHAVQLFRISEEDISKCLSTLGSILSEIGPANLGLEQFYIQDRSLDPDFQVRVCSTVVTDIRIMFLFILVLFKSFFYCVLELYRIKVSDGVLFSQVELAPAI